MPEPRPEETRERTVRLQLRPRQGEGQSGEGERNGEASDTEGDTESEDDDDNESTEEVSSDPEFRLVQRDDPEAYQFAATKYSAHKLPREVVDASMTPSWMKDMMEEWKRVMNGDGGGEEGSDDD